MHEVALSTQLAQVVSRAAKGREVTAVNIRVGALRQVVPETLRYAWGFVTKDGPLAGSALDVEWVPAIVRCARGHERTLDANEYLDVRCRECDAATDVVAGEEFAVVDIEVRR